MLDTLDQLPTIAYFIGKPYIHSHILEGAAFEHNDRMLDTIPAGCIVFPGSGVQENFADKARKLGIKVWKIKGDGA